MVGGENVTCQAFLFGPQNLSEISKKFHFSARNLSYLGTLFRNPSYASGYLYMCVCNMYTSFKSLLFYHFNDVCVKLVIFMMCNQNINVQHLNLDIGC